MKRKPKPPVSILSREFIYTPAHATDIAQTFARIRRERAAKPDAEIVPIRKTK